MPHLNIVADENIPGLELLFGKLGQVRSVAGHGLLAENIRDADVLLVRSVTRVGRELLEGTNVRFVGSATIGTDHVDLKFLHAEGIAFAHAPGSNADSVVDFVLAALLRLMVRERQRLSTRTIGIVGAGEIGGRLVRRLAPFGCTTLLNDPPRQDAGDTLENHPFCSLDEVLDASDIVTVHVPLQLDEPHPTFHLIDGGRIRALRPGAWLVNTSRGAVIDNTALLESLRRGNGPGAVVLDVWENEPSPSAELVRLVDLATPHIAGYAYDAKIRGARMICDALKAWLGDRTDRFETGNQSRIAHSERPHRTSRDALTGVPAGAPDPILPTAEWRDAFVRGMYDIERDHAALLTLAGSEHSVDASGFARLRREYPLRREFAAHSAARAMVPTEHFAFLEEAMGVRLY